MKRMLSFLLALVMLLGMFPTQVAAADLLPGALDALGSLAGTTETLPPERNTAEEQISSECTLSEDSLHPIEDSITPELLDASSPDYSTKYTPYAKRAFQDALRALPEANASAGMSQMVNHATSGGGKKLILKENDAFYTTLFHANTFQTEIVTAAAAGIRCLMEYEKDDCLLRLSARLYEHVVSTNSILCESMDPETYAIVAAVPSIQRVHNYTASALNACDETLILVMGNGRGPVKIHRVRTTLEEITFRVDVTIEDEFDFNGSYSAQDASLAKLLTAIGKLLSLGLFKSYFWSASLSFEVTIPNPCAHETQTYRWEEQGKDLPAVSGTGLAGNPTEKFHVNMANGTVQHYYPLNNTVFLKHDRPWVVELKSVGRGDFTLTQGHDFSSGHPFLLKRNTYAACCESFPYEAIKEETGEPITGYGHTMYTTQKQLETYKELRVYRFENRIAEDGSNQIHFIRDGVDMGPLQHYYLYQAGVTTNQNTVVNRTAGLDLLVNYIYNRSHRKQATQTLEYLQIWENGDSGEVYDYRTVTLNSKPSHSSTGKRTTHCSRCGGTSVEILPETHDEKIIPGYAATCTEAGLTDGSVCTTCGKTVKQQEVIPAKGHTEKVTPGTVTCTEAGTTDRIECTVCNLVLQESTESAALGHAWDEGVITKAPGCKETGVKTFTCTHDASHTRTEELPIAHVPVPIQGFAPTCTEVGLTQGQKCDLCGKVLEQQQLIQATGHKEAIDPAVEASCTEPGLTEGKHCAVCFEILAAQQEIPALGHDYVNYHCTHCQQEDPDMPKITRISGTDRHATAFKIADKLKFALNVEKFGTIIIASGENSADALAGSYLAARKGAPILLSRGESHQRNLEYIQANLAENGIVYILGGTAAVPQAMEDLLAANNISYERLKGKTRFDTNLVILEKAGVESNEILVSTGYNFADSLSASASGKPMLLVNTTSNALTSTQKAWLETQQGKTFTIIGGTGAVSAELEAALAEYGTTTRLKGAGREVTSVEVAKKYFTNPDAVLLAYSRNFPDGLCGGPLAYALGAPLLLVNVNQEAAAKNYVNQNSIAKGYILGGTGVITDETARTVFSLDSSYEIPKQ